MIASLTGPDFGPISYYSWSHWQKKIISSTSNKMLVEFRSDDVHEYDDFYIHEYDGFSAHLHYSPLPGKKCEVGLDMNKKTIQSPNYPDSYDNNLSCKWLISIPHGFHITIKFLQLDVGFLLVISISDSHFLNIYIGFFLLQLEDTKDFLSIHNGGNENSEIVERLTGQMNNTTISISGNQMFLVLKTNNEIVSKGFHALIIESKYYDQIVTSGVARPTHIS